MRVRAEARGLEEMPRGEFHDIVRVREPRREQWLLAPGFGGSGIGPSEPSARIIEFSEPGQRDGEDERPIRPRVGTLLGQEARPAREHVISAPIELTHHRVSEARPRQLRLSGAQRMTQRAVVVARSLTPVHRAEMQLAMARRLVSCELGFEHLAVKARTPKGLLIVVLYGKELTAAFQRSEQARD